MTLGRALLELGDLEAAREALEQVVAQAPENLSAIRGLAEIHHRLEGGEISRETGSPPEASADVLNLDALETSMAFEIGSPGDLSLDGSALDAASEQTVRTLGGAKRKVRAAPGPRADAAVLSRLETFLNAILKTRDADPAAGER